MIPELPPYCAITPWPIADPLPGRCQPRIPEAPCTAGFIAQEYAELWTPPQPEFYGGINFEEGNSHCNQRPECVMCPIVPEPPICAFIMEGHGNSHCNQRPECVMFPIVPEPPICAFIMEGHGNSHCNQRPECVMFPIVPEPPICAFIMEG